MISADVFFEALFKGNRAEPFCWKKTVLGTSSYDVQFPCKIGSTTSIHTLRIIVKDGKHYIFESALSVFQIKLKIKK